MNKRIVFICILLATLVLLTACSNQDPTVPNAPPSDIPTQQPAMVTATEVPLPSFDTTLPEDYDPASEEDPEALIANQEQPQVHARAGATPIPIDPVDLPIPTPRQALVFTYASYTADNLGLTFESVAGYEVDATQPDAFVLREPASMVKDNYPVEISFDITPVGSSYTISSLQTDLRTRLNDLGQVNYDEWQATTISRRSLLDKDGYYGNYRGVMFDGTIVRGRVHMALLDGRLLTMHVSCPGWYNTDYMTVYTHIRDTLKAI